MSRLIGIPFFLALLLAGCASLKPGYLEPEINLVSIKPLPSENLEQRFLLGLRITNPNDITLPITGFSYNLALQGHKVLNGASSTGARIPAFGNVLVELESTTSLMGGLGVIREILAHPGKPFSYELSVRMHGGWWQLPATAVESGEIDLAN